MAVTFNVNNLTYVDGIAHFKSNDSSWRVKIGSTLAEYDLFDDDDDVESCIYFAVPQHKPSGITIDVLTAMVGTGLTIIWEYMDGVSPYSWTAFSGLTDGTAGFTNTGINSVTWTVPTRWRDATYTTIGLTSATPNYTYAAGYQIRARLSAKTTLTEGGRHNNTLNYDYNYAITINDGASYLPVDLYNADVAGGWGVITRDASGSNYLLNANLYINNGSLTIRDHDHLTVGNTYGMYQDSFSIQMTANGTLTLGRLSANNIGYSGGSLLWNNTSYYGRSYLYWFGTLNIYGSKFSFWGNGYQLLTISSTITIYDSIIDNFSGNRGLFGGATPGVIKRTLWGLWQSLIYTSVLDMGDVTVCPTTTVEKLPDSFLSGGGEARLPNIDLTGLVSGLTVTQTSSFSCIDCLMPTTDAKWSIATGYANTQCIQANFSFKLKVVDENGDNVSGATVEVKDKNGNSALFDDVFKAYDSAHLIRGVTAISTTLTIRGGDGDTMYFEGDHIRVNTEVMKIVTKVSSTSVIVDRNQPGTLVPSTNASTKDLQVYIRRESVNTDTNGELTYDGGALVYNILTKSKSVVGTPSVTTTVDLNPFTLIVTKDGYETYTSTFTITEPQDNVITLKPIVPIRLLAGEGAVLALQAELGSSSLLKKV